MSGSDRLTKDDLKTALRTFERRFKLVFVAMLLADSALSLGLIELLK